MTHNEIEGQVKALLARINAHATANGATLANSLAVNATLLLVWMDYLRAHARCKEASRLLDAVQGAIIEASGGLALGLVRSAIFSLRTQLELFLAWIYFNDHPVEWQRVSASAEAFPMRSFYWKYFCDYGGGFVDRYKLLEKYKLRETDDLYGVLSIHVHSTSMLAAPNVEPLSDLVCSKELCLECVKLQGEVAEYISDVLMAWFAKDWHDLPQQIHEHFQARLGASDLKRLTE